MDLDDFDWDWRLVLDYLDVLAWPIVVLIIILVFRGRLRELLGRITQAEGPGIKAQFAEVRAIAEVEFASEKRNDDSVNRAPHAASAENSNRLPRTEITASNLRGLIEGLNLMEAYDEVKMHLSTMDSRTVLFASMFGLGVESGSLEAGGPFAIRAIDHGEGESPSLTLKRVRRKPKKTKDPTP